MNCAGSVADDELALLAESFNQMSTQLEENRRRIELGAAELRGQSLAERTRRLVAIAHPDFREELDRAAHEIARRGF